ncbi:membrane-associated protein, putative [Bodo saltans]|uniref:Membrane-associated protein, putative n=1 Tax=Bodo saltans TaxID=75058 RepID=A0A0S4JNE7_BODSA|nr:membrane-associated protein, putative [Bodo saltans]|eukprot:CUG91750.1 membrane-associated protein, putative [Bodo saltans]
MLNRCSSKREISLSPLSYLQCCFSSSFHSFLVLFLAFFPCLCGNDDGDGINRGEYHLNPPLNETDILSRLHPETSFVCATMLGYSESSLPPWCLFSILRFFSLCVCACVSLSICFNRCCVLRASIFFPTPQLPRAIQCALLLLLFVLVFVFNLTYCFFTFVI